MDLQGFRQDVVSDVLAQGPGRLEVHRQPQKFGEFPLHGAQAEEAGSLSWLEFDEKVQVAADAGVAVDGGTEHGKGLDPMTLGEACQIATPFREGPQELVARLAGFEFLVLLEEGGESRIQAGGADLTLEPLQLVPGRFLDAD